jgi:hypothetical protein
VLPGKYTVRIKMEKHEVVQTVEVLPVPAYKSKVEQAKLSLFPEGGALDLNWKPKKKE